MHHAESGMTTHWTKNRHGTTTQQAKPMLPVVDSGMTTHQTKNDQGTTTHMEKNMTPVVDSGTATHKKNGPGTHTHMSKTGTPAVSTPNQLVFAISMHLLLSKCGDVESQGAHNM
jgi:hypothetical protein